jgi:GAF domain-containing protein
MPESKTKDSLKNQELSENERIDLIDDLLAIGNALSSRSDLQEILSLILLKAREITCSDAGSFYLIDRQGEVPIICFEVSQNDSQPQRSLSEFAVAMSKQTLVGYSAITGEVLNIPDAYNLPEDAPYNHHKTFDDDINYRVCSVIVLPMKNGLGTIVGVMQLINRRLSKDVILTPGNARENTKPYSVWEEKLLRSLVSQATLFVEYHHLLLNQVNASS